MNEPTPEQPFVLVVDDEELLAFVLAEALKDAGFAVRSATNGQAAWDLLDAGPVPATVLLDLFMPGLSGAEVLRRMRQDPRLRAVPVVVLTGALESAAGAIAPSDYQARFPKPFDLHAVVGTVRELAHPAAP